jgi:hypothetical protein
MKRVWRNDFAKTLKGRPSNNPKGINQFIKK